MPAVSLEGHQDDGSGQVAGGTTSTVTINGRSVAINGSQNTPHDDHDPSQLIGGSSTVTIEGQPVCRVGDQYACGHVLVEGSDNVDIGG